MSNQKEPRATVLVIDDDEAVRRQLHWTLSDHYQVLAASRIEAIEILDRHSVDLVLSDLHLPPHVDDLSEGLAIIEAARCGRSAVPVIVITGTNAKHAALRPLSAGPTAFSR